MTKSSTPTRKPNKPNEKKAELEKDRRVEAEKLNEQLKVSLEKEEETIAALRQSQAAFKHSALHDPLTNLANRQQFVDILRNLIAAHKEKSGSRISRFVSRH